VVIIKSISDTFKSLVRGNILAENYQHIKSSPVGACRNVSG
jgi:hypothetical protein